MRERALARSKAHLLSTTSSVGLLVGVIGMFVVAAYAVLTAKMWSGLPTVSVALFVTTVILFCWWDKKRKHTIDRSIQFHARAACLGVLSLPICGLVIAILFWIGWIEMRGW